MPIQFHTPESGDMMDALLKGQKFSQGMLQHPLELQKMQLANALEEYKRQYESKLAPNYDTLVQSQVDLAKLAPEEKRQLIAKMQQEHEYNPQRWQAEMNLQGAQAGKLGKETSWYDREAAAKEALQKAQAGKLNFEQNNPLLNMPGAAGQIGSLEYLKKHPEISSSNDYQDIILRSTIANMNAKNASSDLLARKAQGYTWNQLPAETKNGLTAQGLGMGIDPAKMMQYVNQGMDVRQIAEKEGLDPDNLPPARYFPTSATKTRTQMVEQVGAEMDYLTSASTPIIKRYADTFMGYSPERIKDMLSSDPEAQKRFGQYIGALSVQTGIANGRTALEGGKPGVTIMKIVKDSALKGIDQNSPIKMTGVAFEEAQKTIDNILQKGAKIRTMTGMSPLSDSANISKELNKSSGNEDMTSLSDDELIKIAQGG